jgi:hypothetical protein
VPLLGFAFVGRSVGRGREVRSRHLGDELPSLVLKLGSRPPVTR